MAETMTDTVTAETNRARVRRLLIAPLNEAGFRRNPLWIDQVDDDGNVVKTGEDRHREFLDRVCDYLGYMSDDGLRCLCEMLLFNGGEAGPVRKGRRAPRDVWPMAAVIFEFANALEPCPLDRWPGMKSWFGSRAGPRALAADQAVEVFDFILRHKRPPFRDQDMRTVRTEAFERRRHQELLDERHERGVLTADEALERDRYRARLARIEALIAEFRGEDEAPMFRHVAVEGRP